MLAYWVLPNRDQSDEVLASDGKTVQPLRQILDPRLRPEGLSHGVPTELLEKCGPDAFAEILFAQKFPGPHGNRQIFSVATTAGRDSSGRVVHIGVLFMLAPGERPQFDLPYGGLSDQDGACARALSRRMASTGRGDSWVQSVRELIELPIEAGRATNVALERSVVPFHSLYELGPGGLTRKPARRMKWLRGALFLWMVFAIASVWLSVHTRDCSLVLRHDERAVARLGSGAVPCRFS
jgi:hypothetical protein